MQKTKGYGRKSAYKLGNYMQIYVDDAEGQKITKYKTEPPLDVFNGGFRIGQKYTQVGNTPPNMWKRGGPYDPLFL